MQENYTDCGLFLLEYAERFMTNPYRVLEDIGVILKLFFIQISNRLKEIKDIYSQGVFLRQSEQTWLR